MTATISGDGTSTLINLTTSGNTILGDASTDTLNVGNGGLVKDASGNVGIGTASPTVKLQINAGNGNQAIFNNAGERFTQVTWQNTGANKGGIWVDNTNSLFEFYGYSGVGMTFSTSASERMRIDSSGNLLVGKTALNDAAGVALYSTGFGYFVRSAGTVMEINRLSNDGDLVRFLQDSTSEGSISVSGTTVSYNGGHLSRWAQTTTAKDDTLVKGTVLSNLDEMNVYTDADGNPVDNEQLNKVKVSDVEGDANVAGVFVNWTHDEAHDVDEINMAMTGDMIIRIAKGVTVARGDLLMSAGDGTAKPQDDDIVRSKTVAKVTSTNVTCTYADGSYCVPCVLMAC